jgi:hypothetical protein
MEKILIIECGEGLGLVPTEVLPGTASIATSKQDGAQASY